MYPENLIRYKEQSCYLTALLFEIAMKANKNMQDVIAKGCNLGAILDSVIPFGAYKSFLLAT